VHERAGLTAEQPFAIKNKELFAKAQARAAEQKKGDWFSKMNGFEKPNPATQ
jgi:endonuclease YncB( thermonuclease family)